MTGALKAFDCAWSSALLSGDLELVDAAARLAEEKYAEPFQLWIRVLRLVPSIRDGDTDAIEAALEAAEGIGRVGPVSAVEALAGIVRFLPNDHPDRERILDGVLGRCDELGIAGVRRIIERDVVTAG